MSYLVFSTTSQTRFSSAAVVFRELERNWKQIPSLRNASFVKSKKTFGPSKLQRERARWPGPDSPHSSLHLSMRGRESPLSGEKFLTASHLSGAAAHRDSGWFVLKVPHGYLLDLKQVCLSRWPFQNSPSLNVSKNALALLSRMHPIKHVIHRGTESKVWDHKQRQRPQARASLGGQCLPVVLSHKGVHRPPGLKTHDSPVSCMKRQEAKYCGSWADDSYIHSTLWYLVLNILLYQSINICWASIGE